MQSKQTHTDAEREYEKLDINRHFLPWFITEESIIRYEVERQNYLYLLCMKNVNVIRLCTDNF